MAKSIEPLVADLVNASLKQYKLDYKLENESLNTSIDIALKNYESKSGWKWWNRPDAKLLLRDWNLKDWPILIEYKWEKDKLEKLNDNWQVENRNAKNEFNFKNIKNFAVNWAVHYSNALLHYTDYEDIIAIWITWYKDDSGNTQLEYWVYYVSKSNFWIWQKIWEFSDLSFLKKNNFNNFINKVKELSLTEEELNRIKEQREWEIDASLIKLNNDIFKNEKWLSEKDRVFLVAASIMSTIGIPWVVPPLEKSELTSKTYKWWRDWDIMISRIKAFLNEKKIPEEKKELIVDTLKSTITTANINAVENWESQLKRIFVKIIDDLWIYYKIWLTTDFTWKLFNEMYRWLWFTQDKLNDVVLTPSYVAKLLVKLARVNKDSYVWDLATGSAWLLVAAMNEMLIDAKNSINSPDELAIKEAKIKAEQLLWLEILSEVYMLAVLNMILMGDWSSNILNQDSLKNFEWNYGFGKSNEKFPADAFILNPPYSAKWKWMVFVEKALSMMNRWYAAIIIQNSAWSWEAVEYNKRILKNNTLLASIKMPLDLFVWKSTVQTYIYVFKVHEKHNKDDVVKFIDFSNDWYTRTTRKKARKKIIDTDNAKLRYQEIVDLVRFWREKLSILTENEYYEWHIDPNKWDDWNQEAPIDIRLSLKDVLATTGDYLSWCVSDKKKFLPEDEIFLRNLEEPLTNKLNNVVWGTFELWNLFNVLSSKAIFHANTIEKIYPKQVAESLPYVVRSTKNNWVRWYIINDPSLANPWGTLSFAQDTFSVFYQKQNYYTGNKVKVLSPKFDETEDKVMLYIVAAFQKSLSKKTWGLWSTTDSIEKVELKLPTKNWLNTIEDIDFEFMKTFYDELELLCIKEVKYFMEKKLWLYLEVAGIDSNLLN